MQVASAARPASIMSSCACFARKLYSEFLSQFQADGCHRGNAAEFVSIRISLCKIDCDEISSQGLIEITSLWSAIAPTMAEIPAPGIREIAPIPTSITAYL